MELHPRTKLQLDTFIRKTPHATIIEFPSGYGFTGVIQYLEAEIGIKGLITYPEKSEKIDIEEGNITVSAVRRLYDTTKSISTKKRLVIIYSAELMTTAAQNAFLKLLEEPTKNTHFMLLTERQSALLPTVRSRAQHLSILPLTREQSMQLVEQLGVTDKTTKTQLLFIANGKPAELTKLVEDDAYREARIQIIRDSRELLQGTRYARLNVTQSYKDSRHDALLLIESALELLRLSADKDPSGATLATVDRYIAAYDRIAQNGNIRLQLSSVVV